MTQPIRAAVWVGMTTLIVTMLLCVLALTRYGALDFARLGTKFCCGDPNGSTGYDGQFALYIAAFGADATPFIDGATLRYQRILYPVAARALAFGQPFLAPYTLIIVNVVAHSVSVGLLAYLTARFSPSPYPALRKQRTGMIVVLGYALYFGAVIAVRLDLNEPLCIALGLGAVAAYTHRRWRTTALLLILSTLTKEIGLVFAAGLALYAFFDGERRRALYLLFAPSIAFVAWWGVLYVTFATLPTVYPAAQNIRLLPFNGLFAEDNAAEFVMLLIWIVIPALVLLALVVRTMITTRTLSMSSAFLVASIFWVAFMPDVSWVDPVAAYRVAVPLVVSGLLFVTEHHRWGALLFASLWAVSFTITLITPGVWL